MTEEFNYLGDPISSKLFDMVLQLATDLHVVSHRQRIMELALQAKGLLSDEDLEAFEPTDAQTVELDAAREARLGRILRIITEDGPAAFPLREQWESLVKQDTSA